MKMPLMLLMAALPASALSGEPASPVENELARCAGMQDTRQRLSCFDRLAEPYRARPSESVARSAPAPAAPAPLPAAPSVQATVNAGSFGEEKLSSRSKAEFPEEERRLQARITSVRSLPPDAYLVTLDNGQTWRHENMRQAEFLKEGDAITITRASLGTYRLTRDAGDAKNWIRITRVR